MSTSWSDIPVRSNGFAAEASWWNLLRTAGLGVGAWKKYTVTHTQLQAAALTNDIELLSLPAYGVIEALLLKHSIQFAGSGITAYAVGVGITGDLERYAGPFNVLQAVGNAAHEVSNVKAIESVTGATSIRLSAESVGANLDQSTAGSLDIWLRVSTLPIT